MQADAIAAVRFSSREERDLVIDTLRAIADRDGRNAPHHGRVLAHGRGLTIGGELSTLGETVLALVHAFGADAIDRIAGGHCRSRRTLETTVESLARTAQRAQLTDRTTTHGANAYEFACTQVLGTLSDLIVDDEKAAAE